jgi:hypothetical protein
LLRQPVGEMMQQKLFKITVSNGDQSVQLEGDQQFILDEYVKKGRVKTLLLQLDDETQIIGEDERELNVNMNTDIPNSKYKVVQDHYTEPKRNRTHSETNHPPDTLQEVVKKKLGVREVEWLLIFCFYASAFGTTDFTREQIVKLYQSTGRENLSRTANLSNNMRTVARYGWITEVSKTVYAMNTKGINRAETILSRDGSSNEMY